MQATATHQTAITAGCERGVPNLVDVRLAGARLERRDGGRVAGQDAV
jgi:hypothetical protein